MLKVAVAFVLALLVSGAASATSSATGRDGVHDFDFEIGTWNIAVRRLVHPLTGSTTWVQPTGYVHVVRNIWNGRASLAELEMERPAPHFAGMMLRLYDPQTRQWRIYWAGSGDGSVDPPLIGSFENGRGEFFNQELVNGKPVYIRVVYSGITPTSFRTEQAFSADGGTTWETNLIQTFTRRSSLPRSAPVAQTGDADHQHDFAFEFGSWNVHLRRLLHPLSGSHVCVDLDGTSVLHEIWNGRANIGELEAANAATAIEGLSLRLYHPASAQWSIYFANSRDGRLGTAMLGRFTRGRGEFYDQEDFDGRPTFVRFVFDEVAPNSFRFVQSFSADGARTWEPNWIATFVRASRASR
jgi:hypothetical protein